MNDPHKRGGKRKPGQAEIEEKPGQLFLAWRGARPARFNHLPRPALIRERRVTLNELSGRSGISRAQVQRIVAGE